MDAAATYPLTLLFDGHCPVCTLEMDHLRERDVAGRLNLIHCAHHLAYLTPRS